MFGLGGTEILIICVVALIVIGPQKLPEMLRSLGKGVAEFKRVGNDVKSTLDDEVQKAEAEARKKEVEAELARRKEEKAAAEAAAAAEPAPEATPEPETSVADAAEPTDADKKTDDAKA